MEIESENEISVFPWANIGQKDHSNPYIESTTVLSDIESITVLTDNIINPRRACAARVTVVVLCVCLSVCPRLFSDYRLRGGL